MILAWLCGAFFGGLFVRAVILERWFASSLTEKDVELFNAWLEDDNDQRFWQRDDSEMLASAWFSPTLSSASFGPTNVAGH